MLVPNFRQLLLSPLKKTLACRGRVLVSHMTVLVSDWNVQIPFPIRIHCKKFYSASTPIALLVRCGRPNGGLYPCTFVFTVLCPYSPWPFSLIEGGVWAWDYKPLCTHMTLFKLVSFRTKNYVTYRPIYYRMHYEYTLINTIWIVMQQCHCVTWMVTSYQDWSANSHVTI